jgi:hypothetical protein
MSNPLLQLRMYDAEKDHGMILQWCEEHGHIGIPANVLPKLGVVVQAVGEDIAALWLYMDNSTGVCFAEHPITKRGTGIKLAKDALCFALAYLKNEARTNGYWIMRVFTIPAISRFLKSAGFKKDGEGFVSMACDLYEEDNHGNGR